MASDITALPLEGRRILLGITGSIAAYKAAVLCRLLKCAGAEVRVVMTPLAKQFITPLTMATLSKNPILVEFFDPENGAWRAVCGARAAWPNPSRSRPSWRSCSMKKKKSLAGKRMIVTAGATIEAIDPVRFISNHSSGKMGYAIAGELAARGAEVTLITGRTALSTPRGVRRVEVLSAAEMYTEAVRAYAEADGGVMCAAVADYTPAEVAQTKIKKHDGGMTITLRRTQDIAAELGRQKGDRLLVGFALETDDEEVHAEEKLRRKNFDFIVLNSLRDAGAGFRGDTNKVTFIDRAGREELPLLSKREVARHIADKIETLLK